ncbi:MAG: LytTR family DNA-binding domain-containing protein [Actinomycetia bacterium]|nr:LytTR family DNA-binding domain-containing protein [Actinomycetes bacterium]
MSNGMIDDPILRVAIVEDTPQDTDILTRMVNACAENTQITSYESGEALLQQFEPGLFDLIFLDVFMYELSGVQTAERIRDIDGRVVLVFTTTSEDFTRESYRLNAYKYLVKPLVQADVQDACELAALKRARDSGATLSIVHEDIPVVIPLDDILFIESANRRSVVHTIDATYTTTMTIDALQKLLPAPRFMRSHRSYLVNLDHVDEMREDFIMDNGELAFVTVRNHRKIKNQYEDYLFNKVRSDS